MCFRRKIRQVRFAHELPAKGLGLHREGLRARDLLSWNVRSGHWAVLHRKKRLAAQTVEEEYEPGLSDLCGGVSLATIARQSNQVRTERQIMVPEIVPERLEMPNPLAGECIQAQRAIRKEVIAFAVAPIEVGRGRAGAQENQAAFLVHARAAPVVGRSGAFPRVAFPGLMTEFVRARNGVESPQLLAGPHVKGAGIARRWPATFGAREPQDYNVPVHR